MGRMQRINQVAQMRRKGEIKPVSKPPTPQERRDAIRVNPKYTALALFKYCGFDLQAEPSAPAQKIAPKRKGKLTITRVED